MILTLENGKKYSLDSFEFEHFEKIYNDCLLVDNKTTVREMCISKLIEAARVCQHRLEEEDASEIFDTIRDDVKNLEDIVDWTNKDYMDYVKEFFEEDNYDPSDSTAGSSWK